MDREKVINGLDCCIDESKCGSECPYWDDNGNCRSNMEADALALLKAMEPRVMTLEEYDAWTNIPFTERDPVFHEERTKRGSITCWVNTTVCSLREYLKNDRCWTARPDRETREATPWERLN